MTPNPPVTDPEEPKLDGIYPIALSGSRKPGSSNAVEFTKTGDKLVANNFKLIGNIQAAQNGFGQARLSFIPA